MSLDDAADVGEADARPLELGDQVQPLEDAEELAGVLHFEAHAVVAYEDDGLGLVARRAADLDGGLRPRAGELQGVRDQVAQGDAEHRAIASDRGELAEVPVNVPAPPFVFEFLHQLGDQGVEIDLALGHFLSAHA